MDSLVEKNQQLENMVSYLTNELEKKVKENIELQNICDKLNKNLYVYEELTKEYTINKSFLEDQILKQVYYYYYYFILITIEFLIIYFYSFFSK